MPRSPAPLAALLISLVGCADGGEPIAMEVFEPRVETLHFEIDAQGGAFPQGATATPLSQPWELLEVNVAALFEPAPRMLELPDEGEIGALAGVPAGDLDADELRALAASNRDADDTADTAVFHVLFVDAYYEQDGIRQDAVLGVSLGGTRVIAMFAPVIGTGPLSRFVEQTTLVHELGHAIGLVDNGLAMVDDHRDDEHAGHCNDERCVMFWLNEGPADLREYVADYVGDGDTVVFDAACVADAHAAVE